MNLNKLIPSFGRKGLTVKQEEEHPFVGLQREMNQLFDGFLQDWDREFFAHGQGFGPRIDMSEDDKSYIVSVELPGMDEKDVDVSLSRDMLTIKGEKKTGGERKSGNCMYSERSFGSFIRTLRIPGEIESDKVQAIFRKGILTITLPKTKEAVNLSRRIAASTE